MSRDRLPHWLADSHSRSAEVISFWASRGCKESALLTTPGRQACIMCCLNDATGVPFAHARSLVRVAAQMLDPTDPDKLHQSDWSTRRISVALCEAISKAPAASS